jgi:hypothetical protein
VPGARLHEATALGRVGGVLARADLRSACAGITALAIGFALGLQAEPPGLPGSFDLRASLGYDSVDAQVAETEAASEPAIEGEARTPGPARSARAGVSFDQDLFLEPRRPTFDERFAGVASLPDTLRRAATKENGKLLPPLDLVEHAATPRALGRSAPEPAPVTASPLAGVSNNRLRTTEASEDSSSPLEADRRTAIYDIAAHTVYLPNGRRLEAHSGLGSHMDDPRYVNTKGRGPTPPNVYDLTLREQSFHGVRALRLTPVGGGNMFGRDGMLAHSYMLGPNGQSNGCISFSDYPVFLDAFLKGEVDRVVVVEHLASAPGSKTASDLVFEAVKALFTRS